jgi:hypothetical protein
MGGMGGMGDMFGPAAMTKLMSNPRIAGYFADPQFANMFEMIKTNPQMMMQVMQSDPRFMDVFQEITGIDLGKMQAEGQMDASKKAEEEKLNAEANLKKA